MKDAKENEANPLIVALDVSDTEQALRLVDRLADHVGLFKVGLQLFSAVGPSIVREIQKRRGRIFLDLKLHDIPNTVGNAAVECGRMGVEMITLHTLGGKPMMKAARERIDEFSEREGWMPPKLLGVTILTSLTEEDLHSIGIYSTPQESVVKLARLASESMLDGVVASPHELRTLYKSGLNHLVFVIPGVRPSDSEKDDQARATTPFEAILEGATYLVVGRPIVRAADPVEATQKISKEIRNAKIKLG